MLHIVEKTDAWVDSKKVSLCGSNHSSKRAGADEQWRSLWIVEKMQKSEWQITFVRPLTLTIGNSPAGDNVGPMKSE